MYSLIEATFEDDFTVNSPNHPVFEDDPGAPQIVAEDKLLVSSGADIPGIPRHQADAGIDFALNERLLVGADVVYRSGVYLRGDEVNLLDKTDDWRSLNLRGEFQVSDWLTLFVRVENVFDEEYETFGLLGEPDEVSSRTSRIPVSSAPARPVWCLGWASDCSFSCLYRGCRVVHRRSDGA